MTLTKAGAESLQWRKARRSMAYGNCVEVRLMNDGIVVRDSKNPDGYVVACSASSWRAFTLMARQGHFDLHGQ
jgi:uncharacterized protein DUF397